MYGGKFAFKNRLGQPYSWQEIYRFSLFYFVFEGNFQVQAPQGAYIWRGDLTEGFLRYEFRVLIFGGAYFRNFTVYGDATDYFNLSCFQPVLFEKSQRDNRLKALQLQEQVFFNKENFLRRCCVSPIMLRTHA